MAPTIFQAATLALRAAASVCPASPTCPQDDQCSTTTNGVSLQVSCATDFYGGDLQLAQTSTLAGCISACAGTTGCVAASYVGGNCYMKSTLNTGSENANVTGIAVTSRDTSTPTPGSGQQACPASFSCPVNNGCTYTDGPRTLVLSCGTDFYGGDYANQYAESLEACTQACAANAQCAAASFVGGTGAGTCYLKGTKNGGTLNDNVNGVYLVTASVQPSSTLSSSSATDSASSTASSIISTSSSIDTSSSIVATTTSSTLSSSTSVSSSIDTSSSIVASTTSVISSSTPISSTTSTTPSATPTPTCDPTNNGVNLVLNPSFEQNNGAGGGRLATSWTPSSNYVYPVNNRNAAHTGISYMVFLASSQFAYAASLSQKISTAVSTSQTYQASFYLFPYSGTAASGCNIQVYANNVQIYSQAITSYSAAIRYSQQVTSVFTPSSSDLTLKLQLQCAGQTTVIIDDVALTTACA